MAEYVIPNLSNACEVLRLLSQRPQGSTLASIVSDLGLPRTTALRIVHTLEKEGFVRREDRYFFVGPGLIPLGLAAQSNLELRNVAIPFMREVVNSTGETCHLAVPCEDKSMIVEAVQSPHPLTASSRAGSLVDIACSASGKVFLAHLHQHDLRAFLPESKLVPRTPNSIRTIEQLELELEKTRNRGYALDEQEYFTGVRCMAVPIWSPKGVVGALGITASIHRLTHEKVDVFYPIMRQAAIGISEAIGAPRRPQRVGA